MQSKSASDKYPEKHRLSTGFGLDITGHSWRKCVCSREPPQHLGLRRQATSRRTGVWSTPAGWPVGQRGLTTRESYHLTARSQAVEALLLAVPTLSPGVRNGLKQTAAGASAGKRELPKREDRALRDRTIREAASDDDGARNRQTEVRQVTHRGRTMRPLFLRRAI